MTRVPGLSDSNDLDSLRRDLNALDPDSRLTPLDMLQVVISGDAHLRLAHAIETALASVGKSGRSAIVILTDTTPIGGAESA